MSWKYKHAVAKHITTVADDLFWCGDKFYSDVLDAIDEHKRTGLPVTRQSDGATIMFASVSPKMLALAS